MIFVPKTYLLLALCTMLLWACERDWMAPRTVSTYESISIAWSPVQGRPDKVCKVAYRIAGSEQWKQGYPLWFDNRDWEYRGSLVELQPGTAYEIQLELNEGELTRFTTAKTWTEAVKIKDTVWVNNRNKPLVIRKGGSEKEGYMLYMPRPGDSAIIDVQKQYDLCVKIKRPYVIVRGLILRGASEHGIRINPKQHHIVIEQCDITDWGSPEPGYESFGRMFDSGIFADGDGFFPYHIVIQDNLIHHPSYGANYPGQPGAKHKDPRGPQAISLMHGGGVYVIRHNAIYSDSAHYFRDGMGEWRNFTFSGFPFRESDIHHNYISHCWGDAIEAEGGNENVRVWANYSTRCTHHISTANTTMGPIYLWRNISGVSASSPREYGSGWGTFFAPDQPDPSEEKPRGITYLFHNTITQPKIREELTGASAPDMSKRVSAQNNLFNGDMEDWGELMPGDTAAFYPMQFDQGELLPGFNDKFAGEAPDTGALEAGQGGIRYGPRSGVRTFLHTGRTSSQP